MNLMRAPDLAQRLAAAYALGTLRGGARRRFEAQARAQPALRAMALEWQERLAGMTELQPGEGPSPRVWAAIENSLAREREADGSRAAAAAPVRPARRPPASGPLAWALDWWQGAALAGALTSLVAIAGSVYLSQALESREAALIAAREAQRTAAAQNALLLSQLSASPQVRYVAVLEDARSSPSVLVTFDPTRNTLTLKRIGEFTDRPDRSLQVWALPPGGSPRSLGVLEDGATVRLNAAESAVREVPALAISLEPRGGVPSERGPTGPVLFSGPLLSTL